MAREKAEDYTIGWICALPLELAAATAVLDEHHEQPENLRRGANDDNTYAYGNIGCHNIVITCLPSGDYGVTAASNVVNKMKTTFPSIRIGLMVGIGGGAPMLPQNDIRLGDVVVSHPVPGFGGVLQYDFGKTVQAGKFVQHGVLDKPPRVFFKAVSKMKSEHLSAGYEYKFNGIVADVIEKRILSEEFNRPPSSSDRLFHADYDHPEENGSCDDCDATLSVNRQPRSGSNARVHYGLIASGNQVMKHGATRDRLAREKGVLCFEMEAAGLMDELPSLVIRGICDYCDSHKNKKWQHYAALVAAAFAKELLSEVPAQGKGCHLEPVSTDFKIPGLRMAKGACLDDYENQNEPECLPGTRVETLQQVETWASDMESKSQRVFWMYGMAGTGKSTISRTVARSLQTDHRLGGSFFFKRGEADRSTGFLFFATLAVQLAKSLRGSMASSIRAELEREPRIPELALEEQFRKLIFDPLSEFKASKFDRAFRGADGKNDPRCDLENQKEDLKPMRVLVVDALDECGKKEDIEVIIKQFAKLKDLTKVDIRVFLTSRPDLPITSSFQKLADETYKDLILHQVPGVEHDISLFLRTELSRIAQERNLPQEWPGTDTFEKLVEMSTPLFIYAATVCRFVGDENWNPDERVRIISEYEPKWGVSILDKTYLPILEQLLANQREEEKEIFAKEFKEVVGAIICLEDPVPVGTLAQLLSLSEGTIIPGSDCFVRSLIYRTTLKSRSESFTNHFTTFSSLEISI
ncbi:hypothetical protein TWF481_004841 [Arthrobotrys musiformis]|uniref:Nephrocystin 3-like N-terminal domain-containing protein n=1 Tax=Arthrobotrys musiformis TaxID=47236 RepID=A0AAV9WMC6_9PEZI